MQMTHVSSQLAHQIAETVAAANTSPTKLERDSYLYNLGALCFAGEYALTLPAALKREVLVTLHQGRVRKKEKSYHCSSSFRFNTY